MSDSMIVSDDSGYFIWSNRAVGDLLSTTMEYSEFAVEPPNPGTFRTVSETAIVGSRGTLSGSVTVIENVESSANSVSLLIS